MTPVRSPFTIYAVLCAALLIAPTPAHAQVPQVPAATVANLKLIFDSTYFDPQRFGPARWVDDGAAYTTLERSDKTRGGRDIVRYDTKTGARTILVPASLLIPPGDSLPLRIADYAWSADARRLLIFTNTQKVWRQNTRGDYWVLDRHASTLQQVGSQAPTSSLMYAKFSPQGDRVAYVSKGDLYVERLSDQSVTRLTTGADSLHVNGMSDWVYEEEFSLRDGFRWSPDGERIAFWHFDMTGVGTFLMLNNTDSLYPFTVPIQYPLVGTTNSAVTAGVVSASGGSITWLQLGGDARQDYLPWMEWAGPKELLIQRMNRLQNTDNVQLADATTGAVRTVFTEKDAAWLDLVDDVTWLKGDKQFLWLSERDGWRHVYAISRETGSAQLITNTNYDVVSVAAIDQKGGWLYFMASPANATQLYLFRTRLDGKGTAEQVTPAAQAGRHNYYISPDAKWAMNRWSTFDTPPVNDLVSLPDHKLVRTLVDNTELAERVKQFISPGEFFQVQVEGGVTLDGWIVKPRNYEPGKRYPLLMYVYGEPAGTTVQDSWGYDSRLWFQALADAGYLVASVDNQGTPAPKGRAWRKAVYGQIGVLSSAQQADAVRVMERTRPDIDPTRVAIWGWSGGGSSTLQAMFRYPDVYQVGMSVASVPDQRFYDTIYQERYMGLPDSNVAGYKAASPINQAEGLQGHLLMIHGSGDDNVHYQGVELMLNRLITLNKQVDFMSYPNRTHCICEGNGTTLHIYTTLTRYLIEHLKPGPQSPATP